MFNLLNKIFKTGIVSEKLNVNVHSAFARGTRKIQAGTCNANCKICLSACPVQAISKVKDKLSIDYKRCLFCGHCLDVCPQKFLASIAEPPPIILPTGECLDLKTAINYKLGRSLHVRHLDAGSCNACDFEMGALSNPLYDISRFGIEFVSSPRHADLLMVTGMVTHNLLQAVELTYQAMPQPSLVMAVGACACAGNTYGKKSYAHLGSVSEILPVDIFLSGCPPTPKMMSYALIYASELLAQKLLK